MIPPLAEIVEIPTAVTLVSGKDARMHLDRMLTVDVSKDSFLTRRYSLICDLNGRITSYQLHADLGEQILLFHDHSVSNILRDNLTRGIPWNENIEISSGDGAVHRILLYGKHPERVILGLGINIEELHGEKWTEFLDSMISVIHTKGDFSLYEMLVPARNYSAFVQSLKNNGAEEGERNSAIALQSLSGRIDTSVGVSGNIPFNLGLDDLIDLKKGCYPGQEIHARMESRDRINKTTSAFKTQREMPLGRMKSTENSPIEIISSQQLGDSWINLIVHPNEIELDSEISVLTSDGEISAHRV